MLRAQVKDSLKPENVMKLRVQGLGLMRRGCVDDSLQCIQALRSPQAVKSVKLSPLLPRALQPKSQ